MVVTGRVTTIAHNCNTTADYKNLFLVRVALVPLWHSLLLWVGLAVCEKMFIRLHISTASVR